MSSGAANIVATHGGTAGASDGAAVDGGATLRTDGPLVALRQSPDAVSPVAAQQVAAILTDLETFWSQQIGSRFTTPRGGYLLTDSEGTDSAGSTGPSTTGAGTTGPGTPGAGTGHQDTTVPGVSPPMASPAADPGCAGSVESLRGNAFYCPGSDLIVLDAGALVPVLRSSYGIGGLATAIAHEFGHLIQARIGPTVGQQQQDRTRFPQVLIEAQADCAAGAYLAWATERSGVSGTSRLHLPVAALPRSVEPLVDFRDPATAAVADLFHGYGLDRLQAVLRGYQHGANACAAMTVADLHLTLGRAGTVAPGSPRYPDDSAVTAATLTAVHAFDPSSASLTASADHADLVAAQHIGQFAVASATVLAIGRQRYPDGGSGCYLGAFAAARYGHVADGELGSWRSDADEAMDLVVARALADAGGWRSVTGFVTGFDGGLPACS